MADIREQPYAEWLEACLRELVELKPATIGIVSIMPDGSTGTQYYRADNRDRLIMCEAIQQDILIALLEQNADIIAGIINGEEENDDDAV